MHIFLWPHKKKSKMERGNGPLTKPDKQYSYNLENGTYE